jgi:hypothetical protein
METFLQSQQHEEGETDDDEWEEKRRECNDE